MVDAAFFSRIKALINVVIPDWTCKESKYIAILSLLLLLRTQMSIYLADVNGKIVKSIVDRNFSKFCYRVSKNKDLSLTFVLLDFQFGNVLSPGFRSEFSYGLLPEAPIGFLQREDHSLLP